MQRALVVLRRLLDARSAVSGRPLTTRAIAYALWHYDQHDGRVANPLGRWSPPPLGPDLQAARARVLQRLPFSTRDEPSIAEAVAYEYSRSESRAAERHVERLFEEAGRYEYVHLAAHAVTRREPLPVLRQHQCPQCGAPYTGERWRPCCSRACLGAHAHQRDGQQCVRCGTTAALTVRPAVEGGAYTLHSLITRCLTCLDEEYDAAR